MDLLRRHSTPILLGLVAVAIAGAGGAYAASGGTIAACVSHKGGTLYEAAKCKSHDTKLTWNIQGPAGTNGTNGTNGVNGTPGMNGTNGTDGTTSTLAGYSATATGIDFTAATSSSPATIGTLSLPAGSFMVNAKVQVNATSSGQGAILVYCTLADGSAADHAELLQQLTNILGSEGASSSMPMNFPLTSTGASTVTLSCYGVNTGASGTLSANNVTIEAVQTTTNH